MTACDCDSGTFEGATAGDGLPWGNKVGSWMASAESLPPLVGFAVPGFSVGAGGKACGCERGAFVGAEFGCRGTSDAGGDDGAGARVDFGFPLKVATRVGDGLAWGNEVVVSWLASLVGIADTNAGLSVVKVDAAGDGDVVIPST
jgi:hypothetical protein